MRLFVVAVECEKLKSLCDEKGRKEAKQKDEGKWEQQNEEMAKIRIGLQWNLATEFIHSTAQPPQKRCVGHRRP
ncbi:hypothetical protein L596_007892 [Steinernema carpocapsae]|uniref:Uncharacterized protein n=1 Tax=Steinernema carpocapsae TaxID=34508 RepID=A0A4U5PBT0_STECR|nr:hypothetical protein L596_007892 [Steinernema carpocapsae]